MISVHNLTKIFYGSAKWFSKPIKDFIAVNEISFNIKSGEVVGILGPNGAGKTTTIKMLLDILTPTSGIIEYFGKDLHKHRSSIMQHVAFASTYTKLPGRLSITENLYIYGRLYGLSNHELTTRIEHYLEVFGLCNYSNREMAVLSAGQTTRVMLAKAFLVRPKIILLDEPTAALDPDIALEVRSLILKEQKESGMTVVLASHNMDEVTEICNRVIVLANGTIIDDNTPEQLAKSTTNARITLIIVDGLEKLTMYLAQQQLPYSLTDRTIDIHLDEHAIAQFLATCAQLSVIYSHISIAKPTLEDYFLQIARSTDKKMPYTRN